MVTVRITDDAKLEAALWVMMSNGPVQFTGTEGLYRIPVYALKLLKRKRIPHELAKAPVLSPA